MIQPLLEQHITGLNSLPPDDWQFDYETFLRDFGKEDYFHAFCQLKSEKVVSTGNVFTNDRTAWLANILVDENYRNRGLGLAMTQHIVNYIKSTGIQTQILIATVLGQAVYDKIGFRKVSDYLCYESIKNHKYNAHSSIKNLKESDLSSLLALDFSANAEDRSHLIQRYYKNGFGFFTKSNDLLGAYLPNFSRGLVIVKDPKAGEELLKLKHSKKGKRTLLPNQNLHGISVLENLNLSKGVNLTRMVYGKDIGWNPEYIYSYGSGFCG